MLLSHENWNLVEALEVDPTQKVLACYIQSAQEETNISTSVVAAILIQTSKHSTEVIAILAVVFV